ncbi:MAG: 30S ribosomal protein S6 [Gammaproteobacteria bacterium]|nr:30S ribosomal protein S6 [Gammaproteobacteria bacterium]
MLNHYEILLIIRPEHAEKISEIIEKHKHIVEQAKGSMDRVEEWGRRNLAYSIDDIQKAFYVLLNVSCTVAEKEQLEDYYKFNEKLLRKLVIRCKKPHADKTLMMRTIEADANDTRLPKMTSFKNKDEVDYKSKRILKYYVMETGRIVPSRLTNTSMLMQRKIAKAVKLARFIALLPYCDRHA